MFLGSVNFHHTSNHSAHHTADQSMPHGLHSITHAAIKFFDLSYVPTFDPVAFTMSS